MTCQINGMKVCTRCTTAKSIKLFSKNKQTKDKLNVYCRECNSKAKRRYYTNNALKVNKYARQWAKNNRKKASLSSSKWNKAHHAVMCAISKRYRKRNAAKVRLAKQKQYRRLMSTVTGKLNARMGSAIATMLKHAKAGRTWHSLVNFTTSELIRHLEAKFKDGMTWQNYGKHGWHVDHIIPKSFFIYEKPEDSEFQYCWSLDNLQPLWAADNISKSNKILIPKKEGNHGI